MAEVAHRSVPAVRALNLLCLALITHGSVYPWTFAWPERGTAGEWEALLANSSLWSSLGDVVGNVVLFVPLGVLAWLDLRRAVPRTASRIVVLMVLGIFFAFSLQLLQFFVPTRVPQLSDVVWNALGLLLGMAAVQFLGRLGVWMGLVHHGMPTALILVSFWLVAEWWPLVPTLDWQHVKDALKPLLVDVRWSNLSFAEAALTILAVARLLRGLHGATLWLGLLAFAVLVGKLFFVGQTVSLGRAAGFAIGLLLALPLGRMDAARSARWLFAAAIVWLCVDGLRPFELTGAPNLVYWLPFTGVLEGSLSANALALMYMAFWVGVAMLMADELGARLAPLAGAVALLLLMLEGIQVFLPGRSADTTVVVVPCLWWLVLNARVASAPDGALSRRLRRRSSAP